MELLIGLLEAFVCIVLLLIEVALIGKFAEYFSKHKNIK